MDIGQASRERNALHSAEPRPAVDGLWFTEYQWLDDGRYNIAISQIAPDGEIIHAFNGDQIGMLPDEYITHLAAQDGKAAAASDSALYLYDGATWERHAFDTASGSYPLTLNFDSAGAVWMNMYTIPEEYTRYIDGLMGMGSFNPLAGLLGALVSVLGTFIIPIADTLLRFTPEFLSHRRLWIEKDEVLTQIGIAKPEKPPANPYTLIKYLFGAVGNALRIGFFSIALFILFSSIFIPRLLSSADLGTAIFSDMFSSVDPEQLEQALADETAAMPPTSYDSGLLMIGLGVSSVLGYLLALFVQANLVSMRTTNQILRWIVGGQYEQAFKSLVSPGADDKPHITDSYLYIYALISADRLDEAETVIKDQLAKAWETHPYYVAILLINQSAIHSTRHHPADALRCLRAALTVFPFYPSAYAAIADLLVDEEGGADQALQPASTALEFSPLSRLTLGLQRRVERANRAEYESVTARVKARLGMFHEANVLIEHAASLVPDGYKIFAAGVSIQHGYILLYGGDKTGARERFEHAIHLDPNGIQARLAREALTKLDENKA